jgi:CRP-like cAMP-binding protein
VPIATLNPRLSSSLLPNDPLGWEHSWRLKAGYVRANTLNENGIPITLAIWGPGDIIIPAICELVSCEINALSKAVVESWEPTSEQMLASLRDQLEQIATLFQINRVRPAELRLLKLLEWIGQRFGQVSSEGTTLSLVKINLTHRNLADMCGVTRVTVTKALTRLRSLGLLVDAGEMDLLLPRKSSLSLSIQAMEFFIP